MSVTSKLNWLNRNETRYLNKRKQQTKEYFVEKYKVQPFLPSYIYLHGTQLVISEKENYYKHRCITPKQVYQLIENGILKHEFSAEYRRKYHSEKAWEYYRSKNKSMSMMHIYNNRLVPANGLDEVDAILHTLYLIEE